MPLDPLVKAFLDQMALQPTPKMWELPPALAREAMDAMMQLVGPKDVPIGKVLNRAIPAEHGEIPIRVYSPVAAGAEPMPTMVFFHGGGWVIGNLDTHDGLCRILANESRCRIVAVDYRLSPEHKFPAAVEDAFAAVVWIEANASNIGVDANRLAVGGDSAGGALAIAVTQMAKEKGGPKLAFQMLLFPVTQIGEQTGSLREFGEGYFLEAATLNWFYGHYLADGADKNDPRVSPLKAADLSGLPPAYVMVAGFDPLHDEGVAYAEKLRGAGVAVTLDDYPDLVHDFILMQTVLPQAQEALAVAAKALCVALKAS
jgi:acetyl esterase/lipase